MHKRPLVERVLQVHSPQLQGFKKKRSNGKVHRALLVLLATLMIGASSTAMTNDAAPYKEHVRCESGSCTIDLFLTRGYRAFSQCQVCHGLDGAGSTIAPSLLDKLQELDEAEFMKVVTDGVSGQIGIMPPWKDNANVMKYIDNLYLYLLARSEGVIPAGSLKRFDR